MIHHQITKDATDKSVTIRILDNDDAKGTPEEAVEHDTSGIALWYRRDGAAKTAITPAALAALTTGHTDGGIEHIDDGYYRLDVPDAAFATGVDKVVIGGTVTGMVIQGAMVDLVDDVPLNGSNQPIVSIGDVESAGETALLASGLATAAALATASGHAESAATAATAAQAAAESADGKLDAVDVYKKNVAVTAFAFYMELTDGDPGTGLTVTAQVSKDGGAFAGLGGSVTEISAGWYKVDIAQAEMNADEVALKFTATGAKQRNIKIRTQG